MKESSKKMYDFVKKYILFPGVVVGILIGMMFGFASWGGKRQSIRETTVSGNDSETEISRNSLENGLVTDQTDTIPDKESPKNPDRIFHDNLKTSNVSEEIDLGDGDVMVKENSYEGTEVTEQISNEAEIHIRGDRNKQNDLQQKENTDDTEADIGDTVENKVTTPEPTSDALSSDDVGDSGNRGDRGDGEDIDFSQDY